MVIRTFKMARLGMKILYLPSKYSQQRQTEKAIWIYPVLMAMEATYYLNRGEEVFWGTKDDPNIMKLIEERHFDKIILEPEDLPFCDLPMPDRIHTGAFDKKYQQNGNYKYRPGTHMMAARDCWYAKCSFCQWAKRYPHCETRSIESVLKELITCQSLGFREVFDDSGTFPVGLWLKNFCVQRIKLGLNKIPFSCNMRIGSGCEYSLMKRAGFRMLLYGIESANQYTLNRLKKGIKNEEIIPEIKEAAKQGLEPHIAVMFGYPWENEKEEYKTLKLVHYLLRKGYAKTAQASLYNVPGNKANDRGYVKKIYDVARSPEFWFHKILSLRSKDDFVYLLRSIKKGLKERG